MKTWRILVTGSRDWADHSVIDRAIIQYIAENAVVETDSHGFPTNWDAATWVVVHGHCPTGADAWADEFAANHLLQADRFEADWRKYGQRAGFMRNSDMVNAGADICLAFVNPCTKESHRDQPPHGSHGTVDCIKKAHDFGIPVRIFTEVEEHRQKSWWVHHLRAEYVR